ncbi:MAG: hypothetical protein E6R03_18345 [Hyphomicrobiaceae bacterium]|nr:MAG: hypothetical protein E6R03_18345 [Hyphomicrobiaceae bacterium]
MSEEQMPISAAQLIAEIESVALKREQSLALVTLCKTEYLDDAMAELRKARVEHMRLVAELAGLSAREGA